MKKLISVSLLALGLNVVSLPSGLAQETAPSGDATALIVEGQEYDLNYVLQFSTLMFPEAQNMDLAQAYPFVSDLAIDQILAANRALEAGLDQRPDLANTLALIQASILSQAYLDQEARARVTDEMVAAEYARYVEGFVSEGLTTARHILVANEAEALDAIARLTAGEDFAALAQELSTGPSGPNGGALGTFGRDQMVPAFEEEAFSLEIGTFSSTPVQTQFGFHVVLLEDRLVTEPGPLEAIEDQIVANLSQQMLNEVQLELREGADTSTVPFEEL